MSFKMDFFGKWVEQMRGLFQNQKNATTAATGAPLPSLDMDDRTGGSSSGRPMTAPATNPPVMPSDAFNFQPKATTVPCSSYIPLAHVLPTPTKSSVANNANQVVSSPDSVATKTSSPGSTGSSGAVIGGGSIGGGTKSAITPSPFNHNVSHNNYPTSQPAHQPASQQHSAASFFSNNNHNHSLYHPHSSYNKSHNYHHHHQPPPPPPPLPLHQQYGHYPSHPHQQRSLDHNNQSSTSSSSTSFGPIPLTPSFSTPAYHRHDNSGGLGNRSYSAINTPDSPVNFRRQNSLNVNQQRQVSSRLQLDFRSQKNSPLYSKQSASTDLIDKHSLSPRPRPKDLSLSNSQDNMLRGSQNHVAAAGDGGFASRFGDGFGGQHNPPTSAPGGIGSSVANNHQQPFHQPRPGGLNMNPYGQQNGPRSGSTSSTSSVFMSNRIELSRNSSSINLNGKKYDHLKENDFKHISELGAGSFGQVDKMLHIPSGIELAVKKMRRSGNADDIRHVHRDLNLLQMCNYEHVVQCYGYFILETEVWIFMELMTTCFDHLIKNLKEKKETVPERIIGKVAVATIDTLDYLKKQHSIIHRDIKPSNILINRQGIIKLCDFGISGLLINSRAHTRSVGSIAYMAPERIEPPSEGGYDIRSDIWSMGISLVEIAIGRFPYQDWNSDFEILTKVIHEAPPTLPDSLGFSDDFKKFIQVCLTKDHTKRPKYRELMNHPFYQHYKTATVDVAEWFNKVWPDN